jgi:predicted nucleotidyltransferase
MELNSYFDGLLSNIEPDEDAVKAAKKSHENLRKIIKKDEQISLASPESYLSGSYARSTAIKDIKDVDIIVLLDLNIHDENTQPHTVIAWVQAALQNYYSKVHPQGRSVQVTTEDDNEFQLDVVPAVPISRADGPVWIPDRDAQKWVATHPKGQMDFATQRNEDTGGKYIPLVKIMKFWRDRLTPADARIKSYILESLIAQCLTSEPASYGEAVVSTLQQTHQKYKTYLTLETMPTIADPGYPSVNVAKRWKFQEFSAFMTEVQSGYKTAKEALDSEDEQKSIKLWRKLFGVKFETKE